MAFFERKDEFNQMITCNICKANCSERTITTHVAKCSDVPKHQAKFSNGQLERCQYDRTHIVDGGTMNIHLEFCNKRQNQLLAEYQISFGAPK